MKNALRIFVAWTMLAGTSSTWGLAPGTMQRAPETPLAPRTTGPYATAVDRSLAAQVAADARPNQIQRVGELRFWRQIQTDRVQMAQAIGRNAEVQFIRDNPAWKQVRNPIAPQNDVYTWQNGRLQGGQIKAFSSGNPRHYWRAMLKDYRAEYFLVPDDHVPALRSQIQQHVSTLRTRGQFSQAAEAERQLERVRGLGRPYADYQNAMNNAARWRIQNQAIKAGRIGGTVTAAIEGGIVLYRSGAGALTPDETVNGLVDAGAKGAAVGTAVSVTIILGANPISLPVIVVGAGAYLLTDMAVSAIREHTEAGPMTAGQIQTLLPEGWFAVDPQVAFSGA